jgi:hypothetical protein
VGIRRLGLTLAASLMLALVAATPANAGTASVSVEAGRGVTLAYEAPGGEQNRVTVTQTGNSFTVSDTTAPVTAGAGCTAGASLGEATCADPTSLGAIQALRVDVFDNNDTIDLVDVSVRSHLFGRTGSDDISGGDRGDYVDGGADADTINVRGPGADSVQCDATDTLVATDPDDNVSGCTSNVSPVASITGGPAGPTNETSPIFTFTVTDPTETVTGFECMIDGLDDGPFRCESDHGHPPDIPYWDIQSDGPKFLRVRALDDAPGAGPWTTRSFYVDTGAPQVNVSPLLSTTPQATFQISSPDVSAPVAFECAIEDPANLAPCGSSYTTSALPNGIYVLFVRATDAASNSATYEFGFEVKVTAGGGGGGGTPGPVQPRRIIIESLVLISGRSVKMSRKGEVTIGLQCAGNKTCKGRMSITTAEPVKRKSRKLETLGSTKFSIAANKRKNVKVRFSKSKRKLAKRLKRFKAKVVIREVDQRGNARISSRVFILRAR